VGILSDVSPLDRLQCKRVSTAGCLETSVSVGPFVSCVRNLIRKLLVLCVDCTVRRITVKAFYSGTVHPI
jgi:hypothetical protein